MLRDFGPAAFRLDSPAGRDRLADGIVELTVGYAEELSVRVLDGSDPAAACRDPPGHRPAGPRRTGQTGEPRPVPRRVPGGRRGHGSRPYGRRRAGRQPGNAPHFRPHLKAHRTAAGHRLRAPRGRRDLHRPVPRADPRRPGDDGHGDPFRPAGPFGAEREPDRHPGPRPAGQPAPHDRGRRGHHRAVRVAVPARRPDLLRPAHPAAQPGAHGGTAAGAVRRRTRRSSGWASPHSTWTASGRSTRRSAARSATTVLRAVADRLASDRPGLPAGQDRRRRVRHPDHRPGRLRPPRAGQGRAGRVHRAVRDRGVTS